MDTLYRWRVQEKDKRGRTRWRIVRSPMTEDTARFWAANNNKVIERIDAPVGQQRPARPTPGIATGPAVKSRP